jgi:mannose-1-phosphate guanylyltransferase
MMKISKAFVLGAGLGTRLRPLTEQLPKPLVPVWNRPLITFAFDHLIADLDIAEFAVNTHHCPECYDNSFPDGKYEGRPLLFRHEPTLLDTAGGIDNLRDWLPADEPFLVYNGDILTDLPLRPALEQHLRSGDAVSLILRSKGDELRVGFDPETSKVVDMRGVLAPEWPLRCQFTGIYLVSPAFLNYLTPGKIESVVLPLLKAIQDGRKVGGIVIDEGAWSDLGERDAYLDALHVEAAFPRYAESAPGRISPEATIAASAGIDSYSTVGAGAVVGADCVLEESVIWPGAVVEPGLRRVVVRSGQIARGELDSVDI